MALALGAASAPQGGVFTNPVCETSFPDPTTWRAPDGTWRATSTALKILKSGDFFHWTDTGKKLFTKTELARIHKDWKAIWAPDAFRLGDEYLMFVSLYNSAKDSAIAVYSSYGPDGPWMDGRILTRSRDTGIRDSIDPEVVRDDRDGTLWLFFGSTGKIHRVKLSPDGRSLAPDAKYEHVAGLPDGPHDPLRQKVFEGAYLHRRGGWWYLFASRGCYWNHTYAIVVGRARTLDGPFLDREGRKMTDGFATAVLESSRGDRFFGPGHNGEITTVGGKDYIPYHCHVDGENPKGRPLFVSEIVWDKDGWPSAKGHCAFYAVNGTGTETPEGYVPAMLSNGSLCTTSDFLGGTPPLTKKMRDLRLSTGIYVAGRRLLYNIYGHGRYSLTLSVDGKALDKPDSWSQTLDPYTAKSIVTNVFGDVTRVVETFVASDRDVIAIRQTFPDMNGQAARSTCTALNGQAASSTSMVLNGRCIEAGIDYTPHRDPEKRIVVEPWEELPDGRAYSFTAYGRHIDKTRITIRNAKEDGAFVTFISYDKQGDKPYSGTYADLAKRHEDAWRKYYSTSFVQVPDAKLMRMRVMAEYQLKCCVTRWALPVGIFPSHWNGNSFAFDELYGMQGLLSSGHFDEARHVADFRFDTLGQAKKRVGGKGRGARWYWECMEDTVKEGAPSGHWLDHIFHMSAIAQTCNLTASYTGDIDLLREKMYPVMRECARFYRDQYVYDAADGSSFVGICTDLERLGAAKERPCMTTCGIIHTFRACADAADRLGVDAAEAADWREKAARLEKSLPVKDGRFVPAANAMDAVSMGTLAGYFPFPIFPKGHREQTAAVDFFLAQGTKAGNMYSVGKKICPWYAATMAMAALRAGRYEKVYPFIMAAAVSAGLFGEYWEINEPGAFRIHPWFMTAAGNCLYAMNQMLLMEADGECRIGAGVPKEWKDWSFRLPAESGYEVDFAMKNGKVTKLMLREGERPREPQCEAERPSEPRTVNLVLPDGSRRKVTFDNKEVIRVDCQES